MLGSIRQAMSTSAMPSTPPAALMARRGWKVSIAQASRSCAPAFSNRSAASCTHGDSSSTTASVGSWIGWIGSRSAIGSSVRSGVVWLHIQKGRLRGGLGWCWTGVRLPQAVACGDPHARGAATTQARRHHGRDLPGSACLDHRSSIGRDLPVLQVQQGIGAVPATSRTDLEPFCRRPSGAARALARPTRVRSRPMGAPADPAPADIPEELARWASASLVDVELDGVLAEGLAAAGATATGLRIAESRVVDTDLSEASMERAILRDVGWAGGSLSNAQLRDARITRSRMEGVRATGLDLTRCSLDNVVFVDCRLDLALFRASSMDRVRFDGC